MQFEVAEIETKLISVEGMPGAGKSITAHFVSDLLGDRGVNSTCVDENDLSHPAEYTFHAFIQDEQIKALMPDEQRQLYSEGTKRLSGLIVPLTKVSVNMFGKVIPYKIYDNLDWETEKPVIQERWQNFAKKAQVKNRVYVFNSGILQNTINEMMMRFDFGYSKIWDHFFGIYRSIAALNPIIIYFKFTDIKTRIKEEAQSRNICWVNAAIEYHTRQGYGKRNGLAGIDGYVDCLEARQRIELKILNELPIEKLILTDPFKNWPDTYDSIGEYLLKINPVKTG